MGVFSFGLPARAAESGRPARSVGFSAGVLGRAGGNYWTSPGGDTGAYGGLGFASDAGGFGWGAAAYGEARFSRHVGLALALGYDRSRIQRKHGSEDVVALTEKLTIDSARLGLTAMGILPASFGRLWLGLGGQVVLVSSADAANEISGDRGVLPDPELLENALHVEAVRSLLLDVAAGTAIDLGQWLEIPVELRASRNLSQGGDYAERVSPRFENGVLTGYDVEARSSWEFRLGAGVGVRF